MPGRLQVMLGRKLVKVVSCAGAQPPELSLLLSIVRQFKPGLSTCLSQSTYVSFALKPTSSPNLIQQQPRRGYLL